MLDPIALVGVAYGENKQFMKLQVVLFPKLSHLHLLVVLAVVVLHLELIDCFKAVAEHHFRTNLFAVQDTDSPTIPHTSATSNIEEMKFLELKTLLRNLGGKPGVLRKPELVVECRKYLSNRTPSTNSTTAKVASKSDSHSNSEDATLKSILSPKIITRKTLSKEGAQIAKRMSLQPFSENSSANSTSKVKVRASDKRRFPTGENRQQRLGNIGGSDMDLTFLGTASCMPTLSRGVSCIAFRYNSEIWLFDCGESTQLQMQKSSMKVSKIKKIFISHMHGDHSFGLPGMLCIIGQAWQSEKLSGSFSGDPAIDIYGPEGIRDYVRSVVQLSYSKVVIPHRVHELKSVPFLHGQFMKPPYSPIVRTKFDSSYGEKPGGRDIYPNDNGHYDLFDGELSVKAAPMQHSIPCVGFVISEAERAGSLKPEKVKDIVERNKKELAKLPITKFNHMKIYSVLKELQPGGTYTFPDGTVVEADDIMEKPRKGRKITILGDTCSGKHIAPLAMESDLVIHEATNAWIQEDSDFSRYSSYREFEQEVFSHGHSTPEMAGRFTATTKSKRLILTHFSPRYGGDDSDYSMGIMWRIEDAARKAAGLSGDNDVVAAWDQMQFPLFLKEIASPISSD